MGRSGNEGTGGMGRSGNEGTGGMGRSGNGRSGGPGRSGNRERSTGRSGDRTGPRRLRVPAPTVRLRLTVLYGAVFLITGGLLLTIGYMVVRDNLTDHHPLLSHLREYGLSSTSGHRAAGLAANSPQLKLARAVEAEVVSQALARLLAEYLTALVVMTIVSAAAGWLLAGRALRPLREIIATARRVSGENLGERIALQGPADELRELADTFDGMLERLDEAFASQRRFVANASHELRTPLAIMRTEIDVTLGDPEASAGELRAMGEAVRDTIDRCERLTGGLLLLARSQGAAIRPEPVDVAGLAADCVTDLRRRAQEAEVRIDADLQTAPTRGEPALLERLVANLLDNAVRHNERGGFVEVRTGTAGGRTLLSVRNGGSVIDPGEVGELMAPFRRLDRSVDGFGLGLSIVRSVAEAHGGQARLRAPAEGGLEVTVELPVAPTVRPTRVRRALRGSPDPQLPLTRS